MGMEAILDQDHFINYVPSSKCQAPCKIWLDWPSGVRGKMVENRGHTHFVSLSQGGST